MDKVIRIKDTMDTIDDPLAWTPSAIDTSMYGGGRKRNKKKLCSICGNRTFEDCNSMEIPEL